VSPSRRGSECPAVGGAELTRAHVILIGLPGSGKSTVGPLVAAQLGFRFVDVDQVLELDVGLPVPAILEKLGEGRFRALEREAVEKFAAQVDPMVISPGGGWAAHGANLSRARAHALTVYLKTSVQVAAQRVIESGGRPLLPAGTEIQGMEQLLRKREVNYLAADAVVSTDGRPPGVVALEVVQLARISRAV
jgi:shikimate kinase